MGSTSSTCILSVKSTSECERNDQFEQIYEESAAEEDSGKDSQAEVSEPETTDNEDRMPAPRASQVLSPVAEGGESLGYLSPTSPTRHPQSPEEVLQQAMRIVDEAEQRLASTSPVYDAPNQAQQVVFPTSAPAMPPKSGAPRFLSIPDRCILLQEGATQTFEACAPNCHVFWERDGKPIMGGYRVNVRQSAQTQISRYTILAKIEKKIHFVQKF